MLASYLRENWENNSIQTLALSPIQPVTFQCPCISTFQSNNRRGVVMEGKKREAEKPRTAKNQADAAKQKRLPRWVNARKQRCGGVKQWKLRVDKKRKKKKKREKWNSEVVSVEVVRWKRRRERDCEIESCDRGMTHSTSPRLGLTYLPSYIQFIWKRYYYIFQIWSLHLLPC